MLFSPVFAKLHSRRSPAFMRSPLPSPSTLNLELLIEDSDPVGTSVSPSLRSQHNPCNSHGIISFADPPPLNPIESYRSKNIGGWGADFSPNSAFYFLLSAFPAMFYSDSFVDRANSFCVNLFADPQPLNRYGSHLYKIIGGRGSWWRSPFGASVAQGIAFGEKWGYKKSAQTKRSRR